MRILNVSFKVISNSILESFVLDFKNLAALGAKVTLALLEMEATVASGNSHHFGDSSFHFTMCM